MASVKCPVCGNSIDKDTAVHVGKRYCCADHAEQYKTELEKKKQKAQAPPEPSGYKELIQTVCETFGIDAPTGMILKQIQTYKKAYNFTYDGMRATIVYCLFWSGRKPVPNLEQGLSFLPYKYDEAKEFYAQLKASSEHTKKAGTEQEPQVITIDSEKLAKARFRRTHMIDISQLE